MSLKRDFAPEASELRNGPIHSQPNCGNGILTKLQVSLKSKRRGGYTMIEIVVAMLIVSILAAISFATYRRVKARGKAGAMVAMLESYEKSLWMYCQRNGHYPPETAGGQDPGFLSNVHLESEWGGPFANRTSFDFRLTPMGGQWDWNNNEGNTPSPTSPGTYLISVIEGAGGIDHIAGQFVDETFDDGNLDTGKWVRSRWSAAYSYVLKSREECAAE